jgi:hypothetical protein
MEHITSQPDMVRTVYYLPATLRPLAPPGFLLNIFHIGSEIGVQCLICISQREILPLQVIFTTWNDLGEHHYVGPYNLDANYFDPYNTFPHLAYLKLSGYFISWYKLPSGSLAPPVLLAQEQLFYFYNLQPVSNACANDPVGPPTLSHDSAFPTEDKLYATMLLNSTATLVVTSGEDAAPVHFQLAAGLQSVEVPLMPGLQQFKVMRDGRVLADVVGAELFNASTNPAIIASCNHQTFTGSTLLL